MFSVSCFILLFCYGCFDRFLHGRFLLTWREIQGNNGAGRTHTLTLAAETALVRVNVTEVAGHGNGFKLTFLRTFTASDAGCLAVLLCDGSLVLVDTPHKYPTALGTFLSQLNNVARTGLHTCTAGGALLFIHLRQPGFLIDGNGAKLTCGHTVATAQTAITATGFTGSA